MHYDSVAVKVHNYIKSLKLTYPRETFILYTCLKSHPTLLQLVLFNIPPALHRFYSFGGISHIATFFYQIKSTSLCTKMAFEY